MCSKDNLCMAEEYMDIHANFFEERTDEQMQLDYLESVDAQVNNINGIGGQSLYYDFPFFKTSKQLPQVQSI